MSATNLSMRYRLYVASRVVAAVVGGYMLASAMTVLIALIWPLPQAEAVFASVMLGFVWYTLAVIWVFSVKSATRAWLCMVLPTSIVTALCWWLLPVAQGAGA